MDKLQQLLDEGKMHYFVSFTTYRKDIDGEFRWCPAQGVINRHPFEFIRDQNCPMIAVLFNWKEISEEEYVLYSKTFNHE